MILTMKIYLSGFSTKIIYLTGESCQYGLVAFPELVKSKRIKEIFDFCKDKFLDSGWYSIRNSWMQLSVVDYAKFINQYKWNFEAIANMDTNSVEETINNQKFLERETKQKILPVYHRSDLKEWNIKLLEQYCKEYDYVALWWLVWLWLSQRQKDYYLHTCFREAIKNKTKIHWFWITNMACLLNYPFYSVDSTSRLQGQKFNQFTIFKNWKRFKYTAREYRQKYWLDPSKNPHSWKIWESKKQREKFNDYITKLHQAKWMEYRL